MPKQPHYRLVAIDRRSARNAAELEVLGHYNPRNKENALRIEFERVKYWLSCGAEPSDTVKSLLTRSNFYKKLSAEKPETTPKTA
jgi:small subunit ribosomal protein S16